MALIHIVAMSILNQHIGTNASHEIIDLGFAYQQIDGISQQSVIILKHADKLKLKHIMFETIEDMSVEQFKNLQKNSTVELTIGGSSITKFYLNLLMELNEVKKYGNTFVITIPHEYTIDEILLRSLESSDSQLVLETNGHNILNIRIFGQYIFVDHQEIINLEQNVHEKMFQDIKLCGNYNGTDQNLQIGLDQHGMTKGYFIEGNISNINGLLLQLNGSDRFERYDVAMLNTYGNRISENLLYLPYNNDSSYRDGYKNMTLDSYIGSLNSTRINSTIMRLTMDTNNLGTMGTNGNTIKIYSVSFNFMVYGSGMSRIKYNLKNGTLTNSIIWQTVVVEDSDPLLSGICSISQNPIVNEYYMCTTCNNAFGYESLSTWLKVRQTCPMCRTAWTNKIKYTRNIAQVTLNPITDQNFTPVINPIPNPVN
jgi:hypothetical protein